MRVLVATCAHRGDDARIVHRQARSLLEAGHSVALIAPDPGDEARLSDPPGLVRRPVPRAAGRRRVSAWRAVRRAVRADVDAQGRPDLVLVHDPELVPVLGWWRGPWRRASLVWDVHEDFAASVASRSWIPRTLRPVVWGAVRAVEWAARRRYRLLLAEDAYAERLGEAPVVPNSTWTPPEAAPPVEPWRVVYVGRLSTGRGVEEMIAVGSRLRGAPVPVVVELIGAADAEVERRLRAAHDAGDVIWHGPQPNPVAMARVGGALAGLSLLHDEPNYRHSRPTKCVEYLAQGVPVITTPLPLAKALVNASGGGVVTTAFGADTVTSQTVEAVLAWCGDAAERRRRGEDGHAHVLAYHSWQRDGARFVEVLEGYASGAGR